MPFAWVGVDWALLPFASTVVARPPCRLYLYGDLDKSKGVR